jgi:hypothetical protein
MTLTLELTPEQEQQIEAEARRRNMDAASYAKALLFEEKAAEAGEEQMLPPAGPLPPANGTGADLVAYWEREGLIGSRPDITDSLEHARAIRRKVGRRTRE